MSSNTVSHALSLMRVRQWYKNIVIFLAIVFSGNALDFSALLLTTIGFISLCFMSSVNYILNDLIDVKEDKKHPEKKKRPLACGAISVPTAIVLASVLALVSLGLAAFLHPYFLVTVIVLFAATQAYSLFLKNVAVVDIVMIAGNFVIRTIGGIFILSISASLWLILCPFFAAIFLVGGKRYGDLIFLGKDAPLHKKVFKYYSKKSLQAVLIIAMILLMTTYVLYIFSHNSFFFYTTIPLTFFGIIRWYVKVISGHSVARHPEKLITDPYFVLVLILLGILSFLGLYF